MFVLESLVDLDMVVAYVCGHAKHNLAVLSVARESSSLLTSSPAAVRDPPPAGTSVSPHPRCGLAAAKATEPEAT